MRKKTPEQAIACPLFAEWKLTDAAREFSMTMGIPDTGPVDRIPLPDSLAIQQMVPPYLPLTISGCRRIRRGCRFFFGLEAVAGTSAMSIPVTPPLGYLHTLQKMHRHDLPLTASESLVATALAGIFDRRPQKKHRCRPLLITTDATRIVLPDGNIYDLPLGRRLTPEEAASEDLLRDSHAAYRHARGYECAAPSHTPEPEIFLTADLHLSHREAIGYYCRPFLSDDTAAMDRVLTENWNHIVSPDDSVIFAGDFTYKAEAATVDACRSQLNGTVTWIKGNHDTCLEGTCPSHTLIAGGRTFLVIHNPKHVPASYQGWVIHGHTHNARLNDYPFISFANKTVNISTDVTGYRPVPLNEILSLIREGEAAGRTAPILTREISATTAITTVAPSSYHD